MYDMITSKQQQEWEQYQQQQQPAAVLLFSAALHLQGPKMSLWIKQSLFLTVYFQQNNHVSRCDRSSKANNELQMISPQKLHSPPTTWLLSGRHYGT